MSNWFPHTSLSDIIRSREDDPKGHKALADLCQSYWPPLYSFLRSRGHSTHDAEDLTQGFFASFLSGAGFGDYDPEKGKLRSYLLKALKHYEANRTREDKTIKRGGEYQIVSFDALQAERFYGAEPKHLDSPDRIYDRRWAVTLLKNVQETLRDEYVSGGKEELYETLHPFLDGKPDRDLIEGAQLRLEMTRDAVKMALSRMRKARRTIMRSHIAMTVASRNQIDREIAYLIGLFGGGESSS